MVTANWEKMKRLPAKGLPDKKAPLSDPSKIAKWDPLWWKKEKAQ